MKQITCKTQLKQHNTLVWIVTCAKPDAINFNWIEPEWHPTSEQPDGRALPSTFQSLFWGKLGKVTLSLTVIRRTILLFGRELFFNQLMKMKVAYSSNRDVTDVVDVYKAVY